MQGLLFALGCIYEILGRSISIFLMPREIKDFSSLLERNSRDSYGFADWKNLEGLNGTK